MSGGQVVHGQVMRNGLTVSLGGLVFGYDAVVISGAIEPIAREYALSVWEQGFLVATPTLSAILGSLIAGPMSDRYGRKPLLILVAALYCVSAFFSAVAADPVSLTLSRAAGGLAFASLLLGPLYISEIAPAALRGRMVSLNQIAIVIGLSAAYFSNLAITALNVPIPGGESELLGVRAWRWMFGLEMIPALFWLAALLKVPETPRWLMARGLRQQARDRAVELHGEAGAGAVLDQIEHGLRTDRTSPRQRWQIICTRAFAVTFAVAALVAIAQQITGVNAIYFYAPTVFHQAGAGVNASLLQASAIGVLNLAFTFVAFAFVDRFGRKPLLCVGLAGIALSMAIVTAAFADAEYRLSLEALSVFPASAGEALRPIAGVTFSSDVAFLSQVTALIGEDALRDLRHPIMQQAIVINAPLVLAGLCLFVASFASSVGPVMWVLVSEIFPGPVRGLAISAVAALNSATSFVVQLVFPYELAVIGASATFAIFGILAFLSLWLVVAFVPETKGHSLERLEEMLGHRKHVDGP